MQERDFLQAVQGMSLKQRMLAVQVGDYIEMSVAVFADWLRLSSLSPDDNIKKLPKQGKVKVKIIKISDKINHVPLKVVVSACGIEKEVLSSLFYRYKLEKKN